MNLLTVLLNAAGGSLIQSVGMMVLIIAVFYFFMIRPQVKRQKEVANFRNSLNVGDDVVTSGGIYGKIKNIQDNVVTLEIANNVSIRVDKNSIFASAGDTQQQK